MPNFHDVSYRDFVANEVECVSKEKNVAWTKDKVQSLQQEELLQKSGDEIKTGVEDDCSRGAIIVKENKNEEILEE